jgi:hypothetical protein
VIHSDGLDPWCRKCKTKTNTSYYIKNKKKIDAYRREWADRNKEALRIYKRDWVNGVRKKENLSDVEHIDRAQKHRAKNWPKKIQEIRVYKREAARNCRKTDPLYRIKASLRARVGAFLKGINKSASTELLVGRNLIELRKWFEARFKPGMTWENYGLWTIDYIRPCSSFDLTKPKEQFRCFNYKNLQPLWKNENLSKGNKWQAGL